MKFLVYCIFFFFFNNFVYSQYELDYQPIVYKGSVPKDIYLDTQDKIENRKATIKDNVDIKEKNRDMMYASAVYQINGRLKGGAVFFNDELSSYLNKIVDRLLVKQPEIRS